MARKNVTTHVMLESGDMSSSLQSAATNVSYLDVATIRLNCTSTDALGTVKIQAKQIDKQNMPEAVSDWFDVEGLSAISIDMTAQSPDSSHQIIFNQLPFTDIRVVYTPTSGTGTLDSVKISAKQVGG